MLCHRLGYPPSLGDEQEEVLAALAALACEVLLNFAHPQLHPGNSLLPRPSAAFGGAGGALAASCIALSSACVTGTGPCAIQGFGLSGGVLLHAQENEAPVALAYGMTGGITFLVGLGGISLVIGETGGGAFGAGVPSFLGVP